MSSIESDDEDSILYLKKDNSSKNNKQVQLSQKDMFDDDSGSEEQENEPQTFTNKLHFLPAVAVPEKIVFCIDTTLQINGGYLLDDSSQPPSTYAIRNEAIRIFVTNKLSIAKDTEFALVSLAPGKAELVCSLSSNIEQFMSRLSDLRSLPTSQSSDYDITPMFDVVWNIIEPPEKSKSVSIPPNFILRLILIYGNSFMEPSVNMTHDFHKKFFLSPFCMLDVLYLHDKSSDSNNVEQIFKLLVEMAPEHSYVLENARNVTTMFNKMSKLLSHPCQRVPQHMWNF